MVKVVLDTNILVNHLRQPRKMTVFRKLLLKKQKVEILLPAVVLTELYVGESAAKASAEKKIREILRKTNLVLADEEISQKAGVLMREHPHLYLADALVAATALNRKAFLCTFNKTHFEKITGLRLFS